MSGFRRGGAGKKRDVAEAPIVEALRRCGADVWQISGTGLPDLLVRFQGKYVPLEVKTGKGRFTKAQQNGKPWPVVRTVEEACQWIGVKA